jgi:mlo protein
MVLGFISLLLVFGQNYIIKICISNHAADTMLPCKLKAVEAVAAGGGGGEGGGQEHGGAGVPEKNKGGEAEAGAEHLGGVVAWAPPYYAGGGAGSSWHHSSSRLLGEANMKTKCPDGKVSLISINALHQLHIFIFFLAVFHVSYSAITMALGRAKVTLLSFCFRFVLC